jgi:hypothetical protein
MRLSFSRGTVELRRWAHKREMLDFLEAICKAGHIVLRGDEQREIAYYSATVYLDWGSTEVVGIGLCTGYYGLEPQLLLQPKERRLVFGFDVLVVGVDVDPLHVAFEHTLESVFHTFVVPAGHSLLIAQHEIGVVALNTEGVESGASPEMSLRVSESSLQHSTWASWILHLLPSGSAMAPPRARRAVCSSTGSTTGVRRRRPGTLDGRWSGPGSGAG